MKEKERLLDKENMKLKFEKMTISHVCENQMSRSRLVKKKSLQERGITLISLVVTIVIMLILIGVTIATVTGDNGLFSKAKQATVEYEKEALKEEMRLAILDKQLENSGEITRK